MKVPKSVIKFATSAFAKASVEKAKLALEVKKVAGDKEVDECELVGLPCRVAHEDHVKIFGILGHVHKELKDSIMFKPAEEISYKVRKGDIEILVISASDSSESFES